MFDIMYRRDFLLMSVVVKLLYSARAVSFCLVRLP